MVAEKTRRVRWSAFAGVCRDRYVAFTACLSVLFGIIYYLHPYLHDDIWFMQPLSRDWSNPLLVLRSFVDTYVDHYLFDNGRLSNVFGMLLLSLPKWVGAFVLAVNTFVVLALGAAVAGIWRRRPVLCGLWAFGFTFALPWFDYMFCVIYAVNYLTTSALYLSAAYIFLHRPSRVGIVGAFALGLLLGLWHEQFACAALGSMVCVALFRRSYVTRRSAAMALGLILGMSFLLLAPGPYSRVGFFTMFKGFANILSGTAYGLPFYVYLLVCIGLLFTQWRRKLCSPTIVYLLVTGLISWIVWRVFFHGPRLVWLLNLSAMLGLLYLAARWLRQRGGRLAWIASIALWGICCVHLISVLPWTARLGSEVHRAERMMSQVPDSVVVYSHLTHPYDVPEYLLGKPNYNAITSWLPYLDRVVDPALRRFTPDSRYLLNESRGIYIYEGNVIVTDTTLCERDGLELQLVFDTGLYPIRARAVMFETEAGEQYAVLKLSNWPLRYRGGRLLDIYWP